MTAQDDPAREEPTPQQKVQRRGPKGKTKRETGPVEAEQPEEAIEHRPLLAGEEAAGEAGAGPAEEKPSIAEQPEEAIEHRPVLAGEEAVGEAGAGPVEEKPSIAERSPPVKAEGEAAAVEAEGEAPAAETAARSPGAVTVPSLAEAMVTESLHLIRDVTVGTVGFVGEVGGVAAKLVLGLSAGVAGGIHDTVGALFRGAPPRKEGGEWSGRSQDHRR